MYDIVIKSGTCLLPTGAAKKDVAIKDKKIVLIADEINDSAKETIDATNLHVLPGLIDSQVHFRDPGLTHKEDLETGPASAALGGITTFFEMPNTTPSTTTVAALEEKLAIAKEKSCTNYGFFIGGTGENLEELEKAQSLVGCSGVKIFLGSSTGSLLLFERSKLLEIFKTVKCPISIHSENETLLKERTPIKEQATTAHAHPEWRNVETAITSTKRVIEIAREANKKLHILHITSKDEIDFLRENKDICTVEVTPQHLTLSAPECYDELGTYAQMNPPIRTKEHREGLWQGVTDNTVDVIGSDHAPHTKEEKDKGYPNSPSGMPGVQTLIPIMLNHVANGKLSLEHFVAMTSSNVAKIFGLKNKGSLVAGNDGDITIVNLSKEMTLKNEDMGSKCGWTPFNGKKVSATPTHTLVMGEIVMENGKLTGKKPGMPIQTNRN